MTKAEIVEKVAEEIKISKAAAAKALAVITDSIAQAIKKGGRQFLSGLEHSPLPPGRPEREKTPVPVKRSR